jgi:hypothetical protein
MIGPTEGFPPGAILPAGPQSVTTSCAFLWHGAPIIPPQTNSRKADRPKGRILFPLKVTMFRCKVLIGLNLDLH